MAKLDRRSFLTGGGVVAASGLVLGGPAPGLVARSALAAGSSARPAPLAEANKGGDGPISPERDQATGDVLLALPSGFEYWSFGWAGASRHRRLPHPRPPTAWPPSPAPTPTTCGSSAATSAAAAPPLRGQRRRAPRRRPGPAYDRNSGGACTNALLNTLETRVVESAISINGTSVNCAGGPTPWGSWPTCEETTNGPEGRYQAPGVPETGPYDPARVYERRHGYVFEVPSGPDPVTDPRALRAMARFVHEAVAIDPATGVVYETEDRGEAGFYRFLPQEPGNLAAGGRLQMLRVVGRPSYDTRTGQRSAGRWPSTGSTSPIPTPPCHAAGRRSVRAGRAGRPGCRLRPSRGLLVRRRQHLLQRHQRGRRPRIFDLALNLISEDRDREFPGATYSPDGGVLFVNIQTPGVSFASRGPWHLGAL